MKFVISHHKDDYSWVKEYCDDFVVYHKDRRNLGYNISTIMSYIVENYDHLPERVAFVKDNILERHVSKEEFDALIKKDGFVPLLTANHKVDGTINRYVDGIYEEINNYWYVNEHPIKDNESFNELIDLLGIRGLSYIPFAPGANYIVPKENILKHPKEKYKKILDAVTWTQLPGEAHLIERSLYHLWK